MEWSGGVWVMDVLLQGLLTLEEMKEKQEILVKAREQQVASKLATKTPA